MVEKTEGTKKRPATREIPEGHELRGHKLRLYPTLEQVDRLTEMMEEMRRAWNLLVGWRLAHLDACVDRAERDGVVGPLPVRPEKKLAEDDSDGNRSAWALYTELCRERRRRGLEYALGSKTTAGIAGYGFMRIGTNAWEYGALRQFVGESMEKTPVCSAHQYQAVIKNFTKAKSPRPRKPSESMPLQVMSGQCYRREPPVWATPGRQGRLCNATIVFPGMTLRAMEPYRRARALKRPDKAPLHLDAPVLDGVAIRRETDGWYAAVRLIVPKRAMPEWSIDDAVGVSLGLDTLCATSSGRVFKNIRRHESTAEVAARQRGESTVSEPHTVLRFSSGAQRELGTPSGRLQTALSRSVRQLIEREIVPYLSRYRWIVLAPTSDDDLKSMAQGRQARLTAKRGGYVSAMGLCASLIRAGLGERVREEKWVDMARTCSQCGLVSAKSWRWREKPHGTCEGCGYTEHRKINTARNIRSKGLESLKQEEAGRNGGTRPKTS